MSFKERLFGPPWESKDSEVRRQAVASSDDRRLLRRLAEIAGRDDDPGVRLAALKRLGDEPAWLAARERESDAEVRAAADQALVRCVTQQAASDGGVDARIAWLASIEDGDVLRRVAARARDSALRRAALLRISSQGFLGDCAVSDSDDAVANETVTTGGEEYVRYREIVAEGLDLEAARAVALLQRERLARIILAGHEALVVAVESLELPWRHRYKNYRTIRRRTGPRRHTADTLELMRCSRFSCS